MDELPESPYFTAHQAAAYLHVNEKKLYELARACEVPAARVGGKWLFPRQMLDRWLEEQAHGGLLADRLLVGGAEDPLLQAALVELAARLGADALIGHLPTSTTLGLEQLSRHRLDAAAIHWGPAEHSDQRHSLLVGRRQFGSDWALVRVCWREHGVMLRPGVVARDLGTLAGIDYRWAFQRSGSGSRYALKLALEEAGFLIEDCREVAPAGSARSAAALVASGLADCTPGCRAIACEHGLGFISLGAESLDLALPRAVFFRPLFQDLLTMLADAAVARHAAVLGGYDLSPLGSVLPLERSGTHR